MQHHWCQLLWSITHKPTQVGNRYHFPKIRFVHSSTTWIVPGSWGDGQVFNLWSLVHTTLYIKLACLAQKDILEASGLHCAFWFITLFGFFLFFILWTLYCTWLQQNEMEKYVFWNFWKFFGRTGRMPAPCSNLTEVEFGCMLSWRQHFNWLF